MITCDRCGNKIICTDRLPRGIGIKLKGQEKMDICVPCLDLLNTEGDKIVHELEGIQSQRLEAWRNEWLKNCPRKENR